jgi:hypothetical protein
MQRKSSTVSSSRRSRIGDMLCFQKRLARCSTHDTWATGKNAMHKQAMQVLPGRRVSYWLHRAAKGGTAAHGDGGGGDAGEGGHVQAGQQIARQADSGHPLKVVGRRLFWFKIADVRGQYWSAVLPRSSERMLCDQGSIRRWDART